MDKNKFNLYLCSREWNVKKEAVKERSGGICERCGANPGEAVHHLKYDNLYNEPLEDLQHLCNGCHEYISGKSDDDPCWHTATFRDKIHNMFLNYDPVLACPWCSDTNVHFNDPLYDKREKIIRLTVPMYCEQNHKWELVFNYMTGQTYIELNQHHPSARRRMEKLIGGGKA